MRTGKQIAEEITRLMKERDEIGEACDSIADSLGYECTVYRILDEQYKVVEQKLGIALEREYEDKVYEDNDYFSHENEPAF